MASSIPAPPFARLSQLEDMIRVALSSAEGDASRRLVIAPEAYVERVLRADFLRWLLLEAIPHLALPLVHFELCDSKVEGKLDLAGVESGMLLRFFNCEFAERIDLSDAKISGFGLMGCRAYEIRADRFETKGSFSVSAAYLDDDDAQRPMKECPSIVSQQLRFCGARISGNLDVRGGTFGHEDGGDEPAIFADGAHIEGNAFLGAGFRAFGEVRLNGSTIERNLDLSGAKLENLRGYSLSAAGAHVVGSVYLGDTEADGGTFESRGSFRLEGAKIGGDVKCDGARFAAAAFLLRDYRPPSADEEADKYLYAVKANGAEIGGDLTFSGSFEAWGIVDLIGAKIDGDLNCETGCFSFPGEDALTADGITVSGTTFLDSGLTTNGVLRFPQASLKQGLVIREVVFDLRAECRGWQCGATTAKQLNFAEPGMHGIYAPLAEIDGKIGWNKIRKSDAPESTKRLWLHLAGAKTDAIDIQSNEDWQVFDRFDVTDFDYKTILHLPPDIAWRMDELDRQYALLNPRREFAALYGPVAAPDFFVEHCALHVRALLHALSRWLPARLRPKNELMRDAVKAFSPQPYLQLATVVRASGYESAADDVLIRLERNRTRYSDFGVFRQLGRWLLDLLMIYGFNPFRPLVFLLAAAAISTAVFQRAYDDKLFSATSDNEHCAGSAGADPCVAFNALVFAADTLVPLVDLNQKKNWVFKSTAPSRTEEPPKERDLWHALLRAWGERPAWGPGLLVDFNIFFGWLMTTLFAAGVTGLVRGGKDAD